MPDFDIQKLSKTTFEALVAFLYVFVGIVISPRKTFERLITNEIMDGETEKVLKSIMVESLQYTSIGIVLSFVITYFFKSGGVPDALNPYWVVGTLLSWLASAIFIHPLVRLLKGKRSIICTI